MLGRLYIYGASGMAQVVADAARLLGYEIIAFIDDTPSAPSNVDGIRVLSSLPPPVRDIEVILAFGDCDARLAIGERLLSKGYCLATIIHPAAIVSCKAEIGKDVFIACGAVIDPHVVIGDHTIINTNAIVSHGTTIGKACHLAPLSALAGNCKLEDAIWVGLGAKIIERRNIGARTFIGAGAVVIRDTNPDTLCYGIPANEIKTR